MYIFVNNIYNFMCCDYSDSVFAHITVHFSLKWQFYTYPDTRAIIQERFYYGTIQYDAIQCLFKLGFRFQLQIRISQTYKSIAASLQTDIWEKNREFCFILIL